MAADSFYAVNSEPRIFILRMIFLDFQFPMILIVISGYNTARSIDDV